jgi:hypothetical protein
LNPDPELIDAIAGTLFIFYLYLFVLNIIVKPGYDSDIEKQDCTGASCPVKNSYRMAVPL